MGKGEVVGVDSAILSLSSHVYCPTGNGWDTLSNLIQTDVVRKLHAVGETQHTSERVRG